jgi:hypothetical protein
MNWWQWLLLILGIPVVAFVAFFIYIVTTKSNPFQ